MLKKCALCGKGTLRGNTVVRKGLLKKKGGTGSKIVRWTKRDFLPNLQKLRVVIKGKAQRAYICTRCIKKGTVVKAVTSKREKPAQE
jgi:large subunit ribosomal protein L28